MLLFSALLSSRAQKGVLKLSAPLSSAGAGGLGCMPPCGAPSRLTAQRSDVRRAAALHAARSGLACAPMDYCAHPRDAVGSLGRDGNEESPRRRPGCHLATKRLERTQFLGTNAVQFRPSGGPPLPAVGPRYSPHRLRLILERLT